MISLSDKLDELNYKDPSETAKLVPLIVYDGQAQVTVGHTVKECLPAYAAFSAQNKQNDKETPLTETMNEAAPLFEKVDENGVVFSSHLQDYTSRTRALRFAINTIQNDPTILDKEGTKYSLDDVRPMPNANEPLIAISRPYCRFGHEVPTDCTYGIIQRENGEILFQKRSSKIGIENDPTRVNNYDGQLDLSCNVAHMDDPSMHGKPLEEVILKGLIPKAKKEIGLESHYFDNAQYLGATEFAHTRGDNVFHKELHHSFIITVPNDWEPPSKDDDVSNTMWATPEQALKILREEPVSELGLGDEYTFNNNSRAAGVQSFMHPKLNVITPENVGEAEYNALKAYYADHAPKEPETQLNISKDFE